MQEIQVPIFSCLGNSVQTCSTQMVFSVIGVIKDLNRKFLQVSCKFHHEFIQRVIQHLEPLITNYTLDTMLGETTLDFAPYFKAC